MQGKKKITQTPTQKQKTAAYEIKCEGLPSDLRGTFYRNGMARFEEVDGTPLRHEFDGDGLVAAISLDGKKGTAVIRQRWVRTAHVSFSAP
jgi:carotenoid cleavage dioxygenase-like enzyme